MAGQMIAAAADGNAYRITYCGDGAGVEEVVGWEAVVLAVANGTYGEDAPDVLAKARDDLTEGVDGNAGWDGRSVLLQFEDGSILVELIGPNE